MIDRPFVFLRPIALCCLLAGIGCSHRQNNVAAVPQPHPPAMLSVSNDPATQPAHRTFTGSGISFDYPADWANEKASTAVFAVAAPGGDPSKAMNPYSSLSLDVPTLPWHPPGMISLGMVVSGYKSDLIKNQIHDAVVKDQSPLTIPDAKACKLTCCGHEKNRVSIDVAVIILHADHVYILSADSDDKGFDLASKTLDAAVGSLKWTK
jgi:hypothetical protein